jgi:hypothetical protein
MKKNRSSLLDLIEPYPQRDTRRGARRARPIRHRPTVAAAEDRQLPVRLCQRGGVLRAHASRRTGRNPEDRAMSIWVHAIGRVFANSFSGSLGRVLIKSRRPVGPAVFTLIKAQVK